MELENWTQEQMLEVRLNEPDDFLKVRETLSRIGVASRREKKLYQSCHILHKQGKYYIVHFKELFALDGKKTNLSENDVLIGGQGNDELNGGPGDDEITGGAGIDHFKFAGTFGNDQISDWEINLDKISLYNITQNEITFNQNVLLYGEKNSITFADLSSEEVLSISIEFI